MLKKAMIMAAGVGSRLGPLSCVIPKPMVPVANIPIMDIIINHIKNLNIKNVVANTYYKAEYIQNHYKNTSSDINISFIKETELSGTAGGVKKCQFFFEKNEDFIVLSADGLTDLDINKAYEAHKKSGAIATIVTKEIEKKDVIKYGIIVTDNKGFVRDFQEKPAIKEAKSNLANTGIYIFNYKIFDFIPENTFYDFAKNVFPSIMSRNIKINTYKMNGYWSDIGSPEQYMKSNYDIIDGLVKSCLPPVIHSNTSDYIIGKGCRIDSSCSITGKCIIGNNCTFGKNTTIKNSVIWDNVVLKDNVTIENSVILPNCVIDCCVSDKIISGDNNYPELEMAV
ncbi:MAG: NDP-sugar synthase [Candidatus Gastranaerophilales bacterium]|nr:NDP-sugar synthase [Candidatus Gastranaerophilales bacterium]